MSKRNEVAKVEETSTELALAGADWGAGVDLQIDDLQIPKLLIMQFTSPQVKQPKSTVRAGQIVDSIDSRFMGDDETPVELIIFDTFKTFRVMTEKEKEGDVAERVRVERVTPENADAPLAFEENGRRLTRDKVINYYCLLAGENVSASLPYVLSLTRTSMNAAKALNTMIARLKANNKGSASTTFLLTTKYEEGKKGTYYVASLKAGRPTTAEELQAAKSWYDDINRGKVKARVDESDEEHETARGIF